MSERPDNGPLRLPPEREVTPQLRARVLREAMREDRKPERRPARIGPMLAGLAAAAVVVGVVYAVSQDGGDGKTPATQQGVTGQHVPPHDVVETVIKTVPASKIGPIKDRCAAATSVDAKYRMTTEKLRSPLGRIEAGAYADRVSTNHTQIFCTPFAVFTSLPSNNIVTAQTPVELVAGSRVQGQLPTRNEPTGNEPKRTVYYDGAWLVVTSSVEAIEARLVIDGQPQTWHAAKRYHAYMFAATWAPLTADQARSEITVEYRAISVDGTLMPMPDAVESSTVTPANTQVLNDRRDVFPTLGQ